MLETPEANEALLGIEDVPLAETARRNKLEPIAQPEFLARSFPAKSFLMSPWLPERAITMLYAPRGVGKTWMALNIAQAVAGGGEFLNWKAERPAAVLYIDGEMTAVDLQDRMRTIAGDAPTEQLRLIASDLSEDGVACLATKEGQNQVIEVLGDAKLVVIDNIATLVRASKSNEQESWLPVQQFALELRRRGVSTLFIHHSGKSGDQRGTSAKEDVMDTVIKLTRPEDYDAADGARFKVEYTKSRGFYGAEASSFIAQLDSVTGDWTTSANTTDLASAIRERLNAGHMTQRQIAEELGCVPSYVTKVKNADDPK